MERQRSDTKEGFEDHHQVKFVFVEYKSGKNKKKGQGNKGLYMKTDTKPKTCFEQGTCVFNSGSTTANGESEKYQWKQESDLDSGGKTSGREGGKDAL